jgi:hypothetical protein
MHNNIDDCENETRQESNGSSSSPHFDWRRNERDLAPTERRLLPQLHLLLRSRRRRRLLLWQCGVRVGGDGSGRGRGGFSSPEWCRNGGAECPETTAAAEVGAGAAAALSAFEIPRRLPPSSLFFSSSCSVPLERFSPSLALVAFSSPLLLLCDSSSRTLRRPTLGHLDDLFFADLSLPLSNGTTHSFAGDHCDDGDDRGAAIWAGRSRQHSCLSRSSSSVNFTSNK